MEYNPFYTLVDARNYTVVKLLKKAGHDPVPALKNILKAAKVKGGYVNEYRFPSTEQVRDAAKGFARSSSTAKATPEQSYTAGYNAAKRHIAEMNELEESVLAEAKHKVVRPIDMTMRQISFVAHTCNADAMALIREIMGATSPDTDMLRSVTNWKTKYLTEIERHEETRQLATQRADEIEASARRIAQLRNALHREGIQDPTLQIAIKGGGTQTGILHKDDAEASDLEGATTRGGSEVPLRDDPQHGHHNG